MKVPMSWFGDYTDISGVSPKEYDHVLTMTGSKVECVENMGKDIENVVTGKILEIKPHEDSDHLVICQIDVGTAVLQIVTGAPNVQVGQIVPVALSGSTLPGGVKIKKGKLRGVESNGMLCSHEELGISVSDLGYEPEYGILILPPETEVGMDIKDYFGLNEDVVEYEITSNRPDCLSVIGLARETAASFKKPFHIEKPLFTENNENINDYLSVEVKDSKKCLRYSARMVKNVKIGPSPKWMVNRLKACGVRSINNIVDITNYVLLEYGQPMHAFDLRDLSGSKIIVRTARPDEIIKTLDEQERSLCTDDLVISDAEKAVAIAGVMGGFNSEVKPDTSVVVFESAVFDGSSVRLTSKRVGLRTEASARYEKSLDPNNTIPAVERACQLVELLGCGEIVGSVIDIYSQVRKPVTLPLRPDKINAFLGTDIKTEDMIKYLTTIDFIVDEDKMTVSAPTFRSDIEGEADIAEEIARFYGYDIIPATLLSGEATSGKKTPIQKAQDKIKDILTAQGLYEICSYTFTGEFVFDKLNLPADSMLRSTVKITNPLGEDSSVMRTTTIGSMMDTLSRNYNHRNESAKMFEIGKTYIPSDSEKLPYEPDIITVGMYGEKYDFFTLKGIIENLFDMMNVPNVVYKAVSDNSIYHPGRCAEVTCGDVQIGVFGEIHPDVSRNFEIEVPVLAAEISFDKLYSCMGENKKYKHLPKYPAVTRDIAMLVNKNVPVWDIEECIRSASGKLLDTVKLFDIYEGSQIPQGKKSVAYSISFRAADRSLTNEEINVVFDKIVKKLEDKTNAQLR